MGERRIKTLPSPLWGEEDQNSALSPLGRGDQNSSLSPLGRGQGEGL
jgi:hypothetical protein